MFENIYGQEKKEKGLLIQQAPDQCYDTNRKQYFHRKNWQATSYFYLWNHSTKIQQVRVDKTLKME